MTGGPARRLRLGMVGGGQGASIGAVHRLVARMDDRYELVAGALSANPERARASGAELGIAADRSYDTFEAMAGAESERDDGIDVVTIATPNDLHHACASAFLAAGIHVICDKPMTTTLDDALDLVAIVRRTGLVFGLTHNYTGYPMVRQARAMVAAGEVGTIRVVQVEYPQDWLATKLEDTGHKQAAWRTDPARSGGGCIGDIGTHAFNLAAFVTGLELDSVCAELTTFVPGRRVDDNAHMLLRYSDGARGMLWLSQVVPGNENALRIRVFGDQAGLSWSQEDPNYLHFSRLGEPPRLITRGSSAATDVAAHATRLPPGHPEGFLEGFANIYSDIAEVITARLEGRKPDPLASQVPSVVDGALSVKFVSAAVESSRRGSVWVDARL